MHRFCAMIALGAVAVAAAPAFADETSTPRFTLGPSPEVAAEPLSVLPEADVATDGAAAAPAVLSAALEGGRVRARCYGPSGGAGIGLPLRLRFDAHDEFVALIESQGALNDFVTHGIDRGPCN